MRHIALQIMHGAGTLVASLMLACVWLPFETSFALAQGTTAITPTTGAGSLGTTVTSTGHTLQITGGTRPDNGTNLFHSFDQFNVGRPDTAQFLNTTPSLHTFNILGRVTGGTPSSIFGTIDTMSYPGVNLFLMNPAGIVFGPNATLNVGGSVAFTTADYLRLAKAEGSHAGIFHAETTSTSLLTSAPVAAFGFLGSNPAAIAVQGSVLEMQPGQSISLVGGNQGFTSTDPGTGSTASVPNGVTVTDGTLVAENGQVHIVSVASSGEILAGTLDQTPNIKGQSFGALGTIQISQQSAINTSGEGGGTILIRGGRLIVDDSTISANTKTVGPNTGPYVGPFGAGIDIHVAQDAIIDNGAIIETNAVGPVAHDHGFGGVRITANHIEISGGPKTFAALEADPETIPFAGIRSNVEPGSTAARSGDISLHAASILIKDIGQIETQTASAGNAGHITLKTSGNIDLNLGLATSESKGSSGHAGNITFSSSQGNVNLTNFASVTSQTIHSSGNAGNIKIDAPQGDILLTDSSTVFNSNAARGTGTLGDIQITAHNLDLRSESAIGGDNLNTQVAGNIVITLDGRLTLAGGSFINTGALGPAAAADLIIRTPDILITGENSSLFTGTISSGDGGRLRLFTDNLQLADGGTLSSRSSIGRLTGREGEIPSGSGGVISIQGFTSPGTAVTIDGPGSGIVTTTEGTASGGEINLSAQSLTMTNRATITASSTGPGNAGDISINAGQRLDMRDSSIKTEAGPSSGGNGGNIDVQAVDRVRLVNSSISTSVLSDGGNGGNIMIDPNVVVLQGSDVVANAIQGAGGDITITTPLFLADASSQVSASSQFGLNGTVTIQNPTSNLSGSLGPLTSKPSQAQTLLTQRCAALANEQTSSFIVAGREQLPADPGGWLTSPLTFAALGESLGADYAVASSPAVIAMATQDTSTVSLRRLTPVGFLMANFVESAATGCHS